MASISLEQYSKDLEELVKEWTEKYPLRKKSFDIMKVKVKRRCQKKDCGTTLDLNRHHKGFDSLFARARPDLYAKRYIEFRPQDIVILCQFHHRILHFYWLRPIEVKVSSLVVTRISRTRSLVLLTKKQCESFQKKMIKETNNYIQTENLFPKRQR